MQAAELHKEIYNPTTLPKSHTTKPYFDMSAFTLGNDVCVSPPAAPAPEQNAWKPINPPTHQALIMGYRQPKQNDDRSLTSNTDNQSLANTLQTFETNLTSVITTIFEQQNHQRTLERKDAADAEAKREEQRKTDVATREQQHRIERKDAADAEAKREEQRKADVINREQQQRDEKHRLEKLELRRDKERAADTLRSQQMMIQMMQHMYNGGHAPVGPMAATEGDVLVESSYGEFGGVMISDTAKDQPCTVQQNPTTGVPYLYTGGQSQSELELVNSLKQAKLTNGGTTKKHKTDTSMDTTTNPTRTDDMSDVEKPAGSNASSLTGGQH